ncbi:MAG: hypothetical protein J5767_14125, partial [Paludibacteraceae bacterium]|nr:hypothetical protein [Paludibacteraceae bacterium]
NLTLTLTLFFSEKNYRVNDCLRVVKMDPPCAYAVWDMGRQLNENDLRELRYMHNIEILGDGRHIRKLTPSGDRPGKEDADEVTAENLMLQYPFPDARFIGFFYNDGRPI